MQQPKPKAKKGGPNQSQGRGQNQNNRGRGGLGPSQRDMKSEDIGSFENRKEPPPKNDPSPSPKQNEYLGDCLTCCLPIQYYSVGKCNHNSICSTCVIRMRVLYDENECPLCKVTLPAVYFTKNPNKKFEETDLKASPYDSTCKAYFEDSAYLKEIQDLFVPKCPKCSTTFNTIPQLANHVKSSHSLQYWYLFKPHGFAAHNCSTICLHQRKVFLHEKVLYTSEELSKHKAFGDPSHNIKPHPTCEFCRGTTFYADEDLYFHCREVHETCFICDRQGVRFQYFKDYVHLEKHFRTKHHYCEDPTCKEKKFVVFSSSFELQSHVVSCHIASLPKDQQAAARTLEVNFTVRRENDRHETRDNRREHNTNPNTVPERGAISFHPGDIGEDITKPPSPSPAPARQQSSQIPREERIQRNIDLRKQILAKFNGNKQLLATFSHKTGSYLQGYICADEFYNDIIHYFGDSDSTTELVKEIIALLPDAAKQKELIESRDRAFQRKAAFPTLGPEGPVTQTTITTAYRSAAAAPSRVSGRGQQPSNTIGGGQVASGRGAGRGSGGAVHVVIGGNQGTSNGASSNGASGRGTTAPLTAAQVLASRQPTGSGSGPTVVGGGKVMSDNRNNPKPSEAYPRSLPPPGPKKQKEKPAPKPVGGVGVVGGGVIVEDPRTKYATKK